ncbi:MAG: VOC family protein [Ardenticatenaceae bacterium]|nr:VOC family protein [Ardenticatenaceae bacterium]
MHLKIDHIIYAVHDLEAGMDTIEKLLGERPYYGGQHPNQGTHNALLSLGEDVYLEIIAKDPDQPSPSVPRSFGLDKLAQPRLVTWAVRTHDMPATIAEARANGYNPGERVAGGRNRADGRPLFWESTKRPESLTGKTPPGDWLIPFIIDWGGTPHPAEGQPSHAHLVSLTATHPNPTAVQEILHALDLHLEVEEGEEAALIATIDGLNGRITLR